MKKSPSTPYRSPTHAFSLVELLTVILIIGIISALVVPAVNGFGRSAALTSGGNLVTNLANNARQEAVSKNTMTALVVLGGQGTDQDFRAVTMVEFDPVAGWNQVGKWELLPAGVIIDRNDSTNCTFLSNSPQPFPFLSRGGGQKNPPVTYQGKQVADQTGYAARIFLPNGALQNPDKAAQLRLVEGYLQGSQVVYTHRDHGGHPTNYYDISIVGTTGITKVDRP